MHLGRVIGTLYATRKDRNLEGGTLLLVQPLTPSKKSLGPPLVALDTVGAGVGEVIFFVTACEAVIPWRSLHPEVKLAATDASIVGIVDPEGITESKP
jgi:ethanolamine utilization protein EutN